MTRPENYVVPDIEVLEYVSEHLLCVSDPEDGGHEGVDYENW